MEPFELNEAAVGRLWERFRRDHADIPRELDGVVQQEAAASLANLINDGRDLSAFIAENTDSFLSGIANGVRDKMSALGMRPDPSKQPGFTRDLIAWREKTGLFD